MLRPEPDPGHYVRLAGKLAKRLGLARHRTRTAQLEVAALREYNEQLKVKLADYAHDSKLLREDAVELSYEILALREANRRWNELLDHRESAQPSAVETGFPAGTIGW